MTMLVTIRRAEGLTPEELRLWSEFQQSDPALDSPCFRPEFTCSVAAVREDVEIAVIHREHRPAAFLPFERGSWGIGRPVGGQLSDFHGLIAGEGEVCPIEDVIRACRLRAWDFDHLLASQTALVRHHGHCLGSPYIDLVDGYEAYRRRRPGKLSNKIGQAARRAGREVGTVRFLGHTTDPNVLATLLRWKSEQYRRTNLADILAFRWTGELLRRILAHDAPEFSGVLSALYFGEQLAAAHFGMRSATVLNYWFPAYEPAFSQHSPGLLLLEYLAEYAASRGIRRIDLGKGSELYKTRFMSGEIPVAEGSVQVDPIARSIRAAWRRTRSAIRRSPFGAPARILSRGLRRLRDRLTSR